MGNMELCSTMDQHESLYSNLHAGEFIDRRRNELVAGDPYHFPRQYYRFDTDDTEWSCRCKIWNSISCFCKGKFWYKGSKYSCHSTSYRCLWLVWYSNMDRWRCYLLYDKSMDPDACRKLITCSLISANGAYDLFSCILVAEYVHCLSWCGKHKKIIGV